MKSLMLFLLVAMATPLAAQDSVRSSDSTSRFQFRFNVQTRFAFHFAYAFDPDSILHQRTTLALTPSQGDKVAAATREAMEAFVPLKTQLAARQAALDSVLAAPKIDEAAATTALNEVMRVENTIKRLRLTMLIRSKNALEPEQQRLRLQSGRNAP